MPEPRDNNAPVLTVNEVKSFLEANADKEEVKTLTAEIASKRGLKPEEIQKFLDEQEEGKKLLQSLTDKRVTDALTTHRKTWEEKRIPEEIEKARVKIEEELLKKHGITKTDEQKKLEELDRKFKEQEQSARVKDLKIAARDIAVKDGIPVELVDFLIGADMDMTTANLKAVKKLIDTHIAAAVDKKFKEHGNDPKRNDGKDDGTPAKITQADLDRLAEIAKKNPRIENLAAYSKAKAAYDQQQKQK